MAAQGVPVRDQVLIDAEPGARRSGVRRASFVVSILGVYLATRLILLGVVLDIFGLHPSIVRLAGIWDGKFYLQIAAHGYPSSVTHHGFSVIAFFPLYPMLVRIVAPLFAGNVAVAAIVVSLVAGATACLAVGQLARSMGGDRVGMRAGCLLALAPGAAFLSPAYSEGLAISLCALALIMLDRRRWWTFGLIGALATAASPLALPIVVAAAWAAWRGPAPRLDRPRPRRHGFRVLLSLSLGPHRHALRVVRCRAARVGPSPRSCGPGPVVHDVVGRHPCRNALHRGRIGRPGGDAWGAGPRHVVGLHGAVPGLGHVRRPVVADAAPAPRACSRWWPPRPWSSTRNGFASWRSSVAP